LSLADFVRNVIVNEFAGPEPSQEMLSAIVAYIEDVDFVPNRRIGPGGKLTGQLTDAERRGAALFNKPFPHDPGLSCAGCHVPSGAFVDHRQHDVGSGGLFKTPTLLDANFNAPYFHDGRYTSYAQVVSHFDRIFYLGCPHWIGRIWLRTYRRSGTLTRSRSDTIEAHILKFPTS
jgi:hypothetical protein